MDETKWKLDADGKTVTVTFPTDPPVSLKLDAGRIDKILENLGRFRAEMKPAHAPKISPRQRVAVVRDPNWFTEPEVLQGDSLLHLRDPRFGWLHYLIPRDKARKLAGFLQAQANAKVPQPKGKPN